MSGDTKYKNTFNKENYDRIQLMVKKGYKETIKIYCDKHKISITNFIVSAIEDKLKEDEIN